jgi:hypothetical protein
VDERGGVDRILSYANESAGPFKRKSCCASYSHLPDITALPVTRPIVIRNDPTIAEIAAGDNLCTRTTTGHVQCSGRGALGDGSWHTSDDAAVDVPEANATVQLVGGASQICAVQSDNTMLCWGNPGIGSVDATVITPSRVPGIAHVLVVSLGDGHSCAILNSRQVQCWGLSQGGMLGGVHGGAPVFGLADVDTLAVSWFGGCAIRQDDSIACWGDSRQGALDLADAIVGRLDAGP